METRRMHPAAYQDTFEALATVPCFSYGTRFFFQVYTLSFMLFLRFDAMVTP